jgi:hypothetical protein
MTSPFTTQPLDALMAAQSSVGLVLGALLWLRGLRPRIATFFLLAAIALAVTAPVDADFLGGIGVVVAPKFLPRLLKLAAGLATGGALLTRRPLLSIVALLGEVALWCVTNYLQGSDFELAAAHLAFFGVLVGVHLRTVPSGASAVLAGTAPSGGAWVDDVVAFALGTTAAALVCRVLLHGWTNSGDEWANTFQAAVFAKLRAFGSASHCSEAFRSFWVFEHMGRSFSQYTPGWPLFMAPFVALRHVWLAGPASLGLLAAGVSRLGRRAAAGFSEGTDPPSCVRVRAAGRFAVLVLLLSAAVLINGGSRYPHIFVAAMFAWSIEALMTISTEGISVNGQWRWGSVLGASAAFLLAARPADGCTLGVGLFLYFAYAFARRRIAWRATASCAAAFAAVGGLTLVILRLQLGRWFATGYSLTPTLYPWSAFAMSVPDPTAYKWGIPLATGSYCWWPCSPAVGLAGIASLRGRAQRMGFVFFFSCVPFITFYTLVTMGRGFDLGYGPRYSLPCVVPMAVGTGVALAHLWQSARARWTAVPAIHAGGPAAIAIAAVVVGVVRIAPLIYPLTYADVQNHNRLHEALAPLDLRGAVVFAGGGLTNTDAMDLPENLPLDLYPRQDVLIAIDRGPETTRCVRELYPSRSLYRAIPGSRVQIVPVN